MGRRYIVCISVFSVFAACVCLRLASHADIQSDVTQANFDRIKEGMSEEDVEMIFASKAFGSTDVEGGHVSRWKNEDGQVAQICFVNRKVSQTAFSPPPMNSLQKLRRWFRLR